MGTRGSISPSAAVGTGVDAYEYEDDDDHGYEVLGGSTCSTCHLCISHRFKLFRQQVTVDPATLAPTGQLDPRAIAWVESLGVKPNQTVEVICPLILTLLNQILFQTGGGRIIN